MGLLKELWEKTQKTLDDVRKKKSLKNLRLQGEIALREMEIEVDNASGYLEQMIINERDEPKPDYKKIADAYENLVIQKEKFKLRKEMYKELFGVEPDFVD